MGLHRSKSDFLVELVRRFCAENKLLETGERLLVAVSGGPDSVALLHVMADLSKELGFSLACFHLEHGLRGGESLTDQKFVGELCGKMGIRFFTQNVDVQSQKQKGESIEEACRRIRYETLHTTCEREGFGKIATGHTLDDNIETIIFRLISGTGPRGFSGIFPVSGRVIHPLLCVTKEQVVEFLNTMEAEYRIDSTNLSDDFSRNMIRNRVLPLFEEINANFKEHILSLSQILKEEDALLSTQTNEFLRKAIRNRVNGKIEIDLTQFCVLPDSLKRRVIIECVQGLTFCACFQKRSYLPFRSLDGIIKDKLETNKTLYQNELFRIRKEYESLVFEKRVVAPVFQTYLYTARSPEETIHIHEIKKSVRFSLRDSVDVFEEKRIYIDFDTIDFPIIVRSRKSGDRIELESVGRKKLKSIFIDDKVPVVLREMVPVLESKGRIVGVFRSMYGKSNRVAKGYGVTEKTVRVLVCELKTEKKSTCFSPEG
jgi:tRNA(Ile)-lysidine synthase